MMVQLRQIALFASLILGGLDLARAHAVEPAVLVHDDLRREKVQFLGYSNGRVQYFGADRKLASLDSSKAARLDFGRPLSSPADGNVRLIDGQILSGKLVGVSGAGDQLTWETPSLGTVRVPIDHISSMALTGRDDLTQAGDSDLVLLANGDRLAGFIGAVTPQGLELEREGQNVELAWEAIRGLSLANPSRSRHEPAIWLWLIDGTRVRVQELVITGSHLSGVALDARFEAPIDRAAKIDFAQRHRLVPLAELPHTVTEGGTAFGVEFPPRFGQDRILLHAPITVQFKLPDGVQRFSAEARIEPGSREKADMVLIISDGQVEIFKQRLNRDQPSVDVQLAVGAGVLVLRLDDGVGGPVHDRLEIRDPLVLVGEPGAQN